jgi:hypothetical protein
MNDRIRQLSKCLSKMASTLVSGSHYAVDGNTAEDVNTVFSRIDCFVNKRLRASPAGREYKEKVRAKKRLPLSVS